MSLRGLGGYGLGPARAGGTSPIILWNEAGIASVNMSGIMHHHTIVYEQLKALLK